MLNIDRVIKLNKITSTQEIAKEIAPLYPNYNLLIIAEEQTQGHGRYEHIWDSKKGGLYFTLVLRPKETKDINKLSLKIGESLAHTLEETFNLQTKIKQPNDVLILDNKTYKKVAGILIETKQENNKLNLLLIGIGINVNNTLSDDLLDTATTIKTITKTSQELEPLLQKFLKNFTKEYILWQNSIN